MRKRKYHFARLTTKDGSFDETCSVKLADQFLKQGLLKSFDGMVEQSDSWEHCYTVLKKNLRAVNKAL